MKSFESHLNNPVELRKQTEELTIKKRNILPANLDDISPDEIQHILHDLGAYQIQLEMQNDELRSIQAELEAAKARYFDIYNLAPVGYCTVSSNRTILESNSTAASLLGVEYSDLIKKHFTCFIFKDDLDIYYRCFKRLLDNRTASPQETWKPAVCELRMLRRKKSPFWARLRANITQDTYGNQVFLVVISDITENKQNQDMLIDITQRYKLVMEGSQGGIWDWDVPNSHVHFSRRWKEMRGYEEHEIGDRLEEWSSGIHPDDLPRIMASVEDIFDAKSDIFNEEYRIRCKNDTWKWIIDRGKAVRDKDGKVIRMAGSEVDITERKQMEDVHAFIIKCGLPSTGEDFFESLAIYLSETLGMEYVCIDRLDGDGLTAQTVAIYNNGKFETNVRYTLKDTPCGEVAERGICFYSKGVRHLFPKDMALNELMAESYLGTILWGSNGHPIGLIAIIGQHELKNSKWAESLLRIVGPRAAGELEKREAEATIKLNEARLEGLLRINLHPAGNSQELLEFALSEAIAITQSRIGYIFFYDEKTKELTLSVWSKDVMEQCAVYDCRTVYKLEDTGIWGEPVRQRIPVMVNDFESTYQFKKGTPEGHISIHKYLTIPVFSKEDIVAVLAVANKQEDYNSSDIRQLNLMMDSVWKIVSRMKTDEERENLKIQLNQAQKMESMGRLAGGVAHDFNNMLGVILGYAEMIMDNIKPSEPIYEDLKEIQNAANRSVDIVRHLLAFARKQAISPQVINLNEAVEGMLKILRRLIGEDITLEWMPGEPLWSVCMDPSQLDQILANLSVNARDAINGVGYISIATSMITFDKPFYSEHTSIMPGEYVLLTVSDNGSGIQKENIYNIFDPFFTTKELGKGTGLGLATVYGIVKQNNGFINVYSEHGHGTTFNIYLPRHKENREDQQSVCSGIPSEKGHETIMIVEDEPGILNMVKIFLEKLGYNVLASCLPSEAIAVAGNYTGAIDLLITDVIMPEMTGRELSERFDILCPDIKTLFMSGYTADIISQQGVLDDDVYFIHKPFSINELSAKVREVIGAGKP